MTKSFILIITSLGFLCSCSSETTQKTISGNGATTTETREIESFTSVATTGDITVHYYQGTTPSVRINCDENLLSHIVTTVDGNTLKVQPESGSILTTKNIIRISVVSTSLSSIEMLGASTVTADKMSGKDVKISLNGSGSIQIGQVSATNLELNLQGNGNIAVGGSAQNITSSIIGTGRLTLSGTNSTSHSLKIEGAGIANCYDLQSVNATANIKGTGKAYLSVTKKLAATINGAGTVYYKGLPSITETLVNSGTVVDAN